MEIKTQKETQNIKNIVINMAALVEGAVRKAIHAFIVFDSKSGQQVVEKDGEINAFEIEIDKAVFECQALKAPVAGDLRLLLTILKINKDLERIGDHAVNIAQSAINCSGYGISVCGPRIKAMTSITLEMLSDALNCFASEDPKLALKVLERDDQVDELNREINREVIDMTKKDITTIEAALELLRVSKNLERIADLSTDIAEDVIFQIKAMDIKHHHLT